MLSKKKKNKIIYTLPVVVALFALTCIVLQAAWNAYGKMAESKERRELAEAELLELTERYEALDQKVVYLETEKGTEEALRTKFNIAEEGEEVFVIIDEDKKEITGEEKQSFWTIFTSRVRSIFR